MAICPLVRNPNSYIDYTIVRMFSTYADVVSLEWKCFDGWVVAWHVSKDLVGSPVPLDSVKLLVLQSVRTVEHRVLTAKDRVRDLDLQAAQPADWGHWKRERKGYHYLFADAGQASRYDR